MARYRCRQTESVRLAGGRCISPWRTRAQCKETEPHLCSTDPGAGALAPQNLRDVCLPREQTRIVRGHECCLCRHVHIQMEQRAMVVASTCTLARCLRAAARSGAALGLAGCDRSAICPPSVMPRIRSSTSTLRHPSCVGVAHSHPAYTLAVRSQRLGPLRIMHTALFLQLTLRPLRQGTADMRNNDGCIADSSYHTTAAQCAG